MPSVNADELFLIGLVRKAGFNITSERFNILFPVLEWIMREAETLDAVDLNGMQPLNSVNFAPIKNKNSEDSENQ
jgi:hypothetical protein